MIYKYVCGGWVSRPGGVVGECTMSGDGMDGVPMYLGGVLTMWGVNDGG